MYTLTGLYNLSYLGYLDVAVLFGTTRGLWMVLKLFLSVLLIGTYLLAPRLSALPEDESDPEYNDSTRRNIATWPLNFLMLIWGLVWGLSFLPTWTQPRLTTVH